MINYNVRQNKNNNKSYNYMENPDKIYMRYANVACLLKAQITECVQTLGHRALLQS